MSALRGVAPWIVALLPAALAGAGCTQDPSDFSLVWEDTFDGPAGTLPDAGKWRFDVGTDWGNNQLEYDTDRAENVSLDGNGNLAITARQEVFLQRSYTSGRINTSGLLEQARGRFEARIRLPEGQGIWPAFWLLGADFETAGWPECGEIDVMEYRGQEPRIVHGTIHGPGYSGGNGVTGRYDLQRPFPDDFHVFAVEWDADRIVWEVDDVRYQAITRNDIPSGTRWVFDHPFFVILNVAVGGNFVGSPDASTSFPQVMLVDYVRVYSGG